LKKRKLEMTFWVRCSLEQGMLPGEYAVEMNTSEAGRISLFAPEDKVRPDENLMRVEMLQEGNGSGVLVRLPAPPFEIASQNVRVPQEDLLTE
jgi:hypothetical protein